MFCASKSFSQYQRENKLLSAAKKRSQFFFGDKLKKESGNRRQAMSSKNVYVIDLDDVHYLDPNFSLNFLFSYFDKKIVLMNCVDMEEAGIRMYRSQFSTDFIAT